MHIANIKIKNFRLLQDTTIELREKLSLAIGRNNCGKTSLLVILQKFYENDKFNYNDFSLSLRPHINNISEETNVADLSIKMILEIEYDEDDNLENLSEFILDLDPNIKTAKILFECIIDKKAILKELATIPDANKEKYIIKHIDRYLIKDIYIFEKDEDLINADRSRFIKKDLKAVKSLINLQIIHAKRNVSSSEEGKNDKKTLSVLTTEYFNSENSHPNAELVAINEKIVGMDATLNESYVGFFDNFLRNSKEFLNLGDLKVISDIQSRELISNASKVIYGSEDNHLPEHLNGLGFMNILFLLLTIEIKKNNFKKEGKDINLLFIEEPEAHTHPQMQYIFANKIQSAFDDIHNLQALITTHSACIVSQSNFEDIRYLIVNDKNVQVKNFHTELKARYNDNDDFKFLEQYLNIQSAELFFASKVIFIEGITEQILLPYFIDKFDRENKEKTNYVPLSSQNISILEVGANAKAFQPFLEFLNIKTLIITDIDTELKTRIKNETTGKFKVKRKAAAVVDSNYTNNSTLTHFFEAPKPTSEDYSEWFNKLKNHSLQHRNTNIVIAYQEIENSYHARSFEDAFIQINIEAIKSNADKLWGIKNKGSLQTITDIYKLTNKVLEKKSDFASSLLYLALTESIEWKTPSYIKSGLNWINSDASI